MIKKRKGRKRKECKREREKVTEKMRKRRIERDINRKSEK
jgi:hypothetical protein